jgi:hypothetical protein
MGAGSTSVYHLMIADFYIGRYRFTTEWVFDGNQIGYLAEGLNLFLEFILD